MIVSNLYSWRHPWKNLNSWYWDIKRGVRNLFIFFDAVWWFHSFDYTGMLRLLEVSAHQMRLSLKAHVGAEKDIKQLIIVETLARRLREDDYFANAGYDSKKWNTFSDEEHCRISNHASYMSKQDAEFLGHTMRFVQHWWD